MYDPITNPTAAANAFLHLTILGVGLSLIVYDRRTPTTRALAASFALWGSQELMRLWLRALGLWPPSHTIQSIGWATGYLSSIAVAEYLILILRTASTGDRFVAAGQGMLRVNQLLTVIYFLLELTLPDLSQENLDAVGPGFWLFKSLELLGHFTLVLPVIILVLRGVDFQEKRRMLAIIAATPFFMTSGILPNGMMQILSTLLGVLVILIGCMGYLVAQGRRGEFMSRFLSPQIRDRVHEQGLLKTLHQSQAEITIVCCDLRGFTAYAQKNPSSRVIEILKIYYDAAGDIAERHGATIKDFAGDGVLLLVGAPDPHENHALAGVALAHALVSRVQSITRQHSDPQLQLGVGAGVASGPVTVGVIESKSRMEYAAVGSAVNLAARLCSVAAHGEVRISHRTAELSQLPGLRELPVLSLKGLGDDIQNYLFTESEPSAITVESADLT